MDQRASLGDVGMSQFLFPTSSTLFMFQTMICEMLGNPIAVMPVPHRGLSLSWLSPELVTRLTDTEILSRLECASFVQLLDYERASEEADCWLIVANGMAAGYPDGV